MSKIGMKEEKNPKIPKTVIKQSWKRPNHSPEFNEVTHMDNGIRVGNVSLLGYNLQWNKFF